jgi:hypothetical protein
MAPHVAATLPACLQTSKGLSFGLRGPRKKKATYRKREVSEQYTLARFDPVLLDVMEDAVAGKLSQDEYPFVRLVGCEPGFHLYCTWGCLMLGWLRGTCWTMTAEACVADCCHKHLRTQGKPSR